MGARGDLGHDAAIGPVRRLLAGQPVGEDAPVRRDQGRRGLVAARFDAEDQAHRGLPCHSPTPLAQARMDRPLRIGTRGSPLALAQARLVADALRAAHGWGEEAIEIVPITTTRRP